MTFFGPQAAQQYKLQLTRDRTRVLKQGYPWIYADNFAELPPAASGSRAMVRDLDGSLIAFGMYDPQSSLCFRVLALEKERLDDALIEKRLFAALKLRRQLFDSRTTGFRLLNGEGDRLPGLVCDLYGTTAVIKLDGAGPNAFWNLEGIADWLVAHAGVSTVFYKPRGDETHDGSLVRGQLPTSEIEFLEHGVRFKANIVKGQKSGFFLDQRDNRARFGKLAKGRSVLNICGYTGGFSVYAGLGGATQVTTVDIAKPAIDAAQENWELNQLPPQAHTGVAMDAFQFLAQARDAGQGWGLIVVDPPSFAPSERVVDRAREGYQSLFTAALQVADEGAIVALSSCSSHISTAMFYEICQSSVSRARRRATVMGVYGQPEDHPFPLPCTELQYLKFVVLAL